MACNPGVCPNSARGYSTRWHAALHPSGHGPPFPPSISLDITHPLPSPSFSCLCGDYASPRSSSSQRPPTFPASQWKFPTPVPPTPDFLTLTRPALPRPASPCPALIRPALPCPALPCPVPPCPALRRRVPVPAVLGQGRPHRAVLPEDAAAVCEDQAGAAVEQRHPVPDPRDLGRRRNRPRRLDLEHEPHPEDRL